MAIHLHLLDEHDRAMFDEPTKRIVTAGVLPYTVWRKQVLFLLGKEGYALDYIDSDRWSDFAGQLNDGESLSEGAARECYEETAGCLLSIEELRHRLDSGDYLLHSDLHPRRSKSFRTYLMFVPYADYPAFFRRVTRFLQYPSVGGDIRVVEKSQLAWFTYRELRDIVFHTSSSTMYKRQPKCRARFAENIRRIMACVNLQQACTTTHRISTFRGE